MKKLISAVTAGAILITLSANSFAQTLNLSYDGKVHKYTGDVLKLKINDEIVATDVPPIILGNRSLVPVRTVFEKLGATVGWDSKNKKITVSMNNKSMELKVNDTNAKINNKVVKMDVPAKVINNRTMVPLRFVGEQLDMVVAWRPKDKLVSIDNKQDTSKKDDTKPKDIRGNLKGINYIKGQDKDQMIIMVDDYSDYVISVLKNPNKLILNIPKTGIEEGRAIEVNSSLVNNVKYDKDGSSTKVVLDLAREVKYTVEEKKGQLIVNFSMPEKVIPEKVTPEKTNIIDNSQGFKDKPLDGPIKEQPSPFDPDKDQLNQLEQNLGVKNNSSETRIKNIAYYNSSDRVYFSLKGAYLTEGGENLKKLYEESYSNDGKKYVITFPSNFADIGAGKMDINDSYLDSIEVARDTTINKTSIIFNAKSKFTYLIIARPDAGVNDTAINILKPVSKAEKLVVIDPGHGSAAEPGAVSGGICEKDINLDISKRLNALLKQKGIRTYMMREDDSFVGLYERAYIANALNASLFMCIHNNAVDSKSVGGTMTLYFPQSANSAGFSSKRYAELVQQQLVAKLGTTDRHIIERPNLVVLKATDMPAALAEVSFMTNNNELRQLMTDSYKQKAAQALCDAIIQSLSEIK